MIIYLGMIGWCTTPDDAWKHNTLRQCGEPVMAKPREYSMLKLSLDIDDTITVDPDFFAMVSRGVHACGGEVHVVSSRSREAMKQTRSEIDAYGIVYSSIFLLPSLREAQVLCPHRDLDWYQKHLWLKIGYALANEISHAVDDDQRVLSLFKRYALGVRTIHVDDRLRLLDILNVRTDDIE